MSDCDHGDDEGLGPSQGCNYLNLYKETGCRTWYSRRVFHCSRHGQCYHQEEKRYWEACQNSPHPPARDCKCFDGGPGWRCRDGFCIDASDVCDGREHCPDGSDESTEANLGCNLFLSENCTSYRGERYVRCEADSAVCVPETFLANNLSDPRDCRQCGGGGGGGGEGEELQWRCDDGSCIPARLYRDGSPDCLDGSDHQSLLLPIIQQVATIIFFYFILLIIKNYFK